MALKLTCPACAAVFALAEDVRGKKAFCPKCGALLIVTSSGVAKENERPRPAPAHTAPARGWRSLWLLLAVPLVLPPVGLAVYLLARGSTDKPKQVAQKGPAEETKQVAQKGPAEETHQGAGLHEGEVKRVTDSTDRAGMGLRHQQAADKLAALIKDNEVLPRKALPGKPFTHQLPKVEGAQYRILSPMPLAGMTITPDGLLAWTPRPGQRATTYDVQLRIDNVSAPSGLSSTGPRIRTIKIVLEAGPENALALPSIGGWVMLSDGVTLIVALPDQKQLVYIDTVAHKERKRVTLPFQPNCLAVQGKRLFVSAETERADFHVLDLNTGADKKTITFPGSWLTEMVCHREKGLIYAIGDNLLAIDPDAGLAEPVVIDPDGAGGGLNEFNFAFSPGLAMSPRNANELYAITDGPANANAFLRKFTVKGKNLKGACVYTTASSPTSLPRAAIGRDKMRFLVRVSDDGKRVGAFAGDKCPSGNLGITLFDVKSLAGVGPPAKAPGRKLAPPPPPRVTGIANCDAYPRDLAFHPVLDLGVAAQGEAEPLPTRPSSGSPRPPSRPGAPTRPSSGSPRPSSRPGAASGKELLPQSVATRSVLHVFNCTTLIETTFNLPYNLNGRLLTFGARGTKLIYYDTAGYLRSLPLSLTNEDKEALAKAYPVEGR